VPVVGSAAVSRTFVKSPGQSGALLPTRSSPEDEFRFDQTIATKDWPELDQPQAIGAICPGG